MGGQEEADDSHGVVFEAARLLIGGGVGGGVGKDGDGGGVGVVGGDAGGATCISSLRFHPNVTVPVRFSLIVFLCKHREPVCVICVYA